MRKSPLALAALLAALSLPNVASAKQPAPPKPAPVPAPAPQPAQDKRPVAPDVDNPMLSSVPPAPHTLAGWEEALAMINSRDADLKTALLEVERLRGERRQALAPALPQITATGSVTVALIRQDITATNPLNGMMTTVTEPPSPVENASLTLSQAILAPRVWYGIGTADKAIDLANMSVDDARRTLVGNVADSIVAVVTAEQVAEINRVELKAALGRLALQKRKVDLGGGANLDTVRYEQDANAARSTLLAGDEQLRQARERLGIALGSQEAYGVPPNIKLDDIEASAGKTCKSGKLQDRADIRALYARKELTARKVTDADLMYSPTAEVSTTLAGSNEQIVGDGHVSWNVMGVISIPIWDGGLRYGARRAAKAEVDEDQQKIDSAERQANVEISQAERAIEVAGRAEKLAEESRDLARENERLAELAVEGGAGTSFDIVDASGKLRQAELNLAVKELDLTRAKITALLATATCDY